MSAQSSGPRGATRSRKRPTKAAPPAAPTMESVIALIREVVAQYCAPRLLRVLRRGDLALEEPALVTWSFAATDRYPAALGGAFVLTITPRYERNPCEQIERPSETRFISLCGLTREAITNALFHALTWPGSPYWFDGKQWDRKTSIYG